MLGYRLARAGIPVVEKHADFFRDFRGDTIHPSSMEVLRELGLLEKFLKLPQTPTDQIEANFGSESLVLADFRSLPVAAPFIAIIPQWDFLNFMVEAGKAYPDFEVMMKTEAKDLIVENGVVVGMKAATADGEVDIRAELVIAADGRYSAIAKKAGLEVEDLGAPIDVLWFRLSRDSNASTRSFGYIGPGRFMATINRNTYWQCAFVIAKGDFENFKQRGVDGFRAEIARLAPPLAGVVNKIKTWDDVKLLNVSVDHLRRWFKPGLLCIGDAAHAMSPVGGVGINIAIQDAIAAANILIPAFKRGTPAVGDLEQVQARRSPPARKTQRLQVLVHNRLIAPVLKATDRSVRIPWFFKPLQWFPSLRRVPAQTIGMGFLPEHVVDA
jgi:2-polyprenyl-6-methoxyphenol hydroxylase-like FAD-dependent oxidoreductase